MATINPVVEKLANQYVAQGHAIVPKELYELFERALVARGLQVPTKQIHLSEYTFFLVYDARFEYEARWNEQSQKWTHHLTEKPKSKLLGNPLGRDTSGDSNMYKISRPNPPQIIKFSLHGWGWYTLEGLVNALKEYGLVTTPVLILRNAGSASLSKDPGFITIATLDGQMQTVSMEALQKTLQALESNPELAKEILVPAGWGNRFLALFDEEQIFVDRSTAVSEAFKIALKFYAQGYVTVPANVWEVTEFALLNISQQTSGKVYRIENKEGLTDYLCVDPDRFEVNWASYGSDFLKERNDLLEKGWEVVAADEVMENGCVYFIRRI